MLTLRKDNSASARLCAASMLAGNVIIIPTDTVYGISAIADDPLSQNDNGAGAIRAIKGRAQSKPFITLIEKPSDIHLYTDEDIPQSLLSKWPGALTLVVPSKHPASHLSPDANCLSLPSNLSTIALRCPGDKWLRSVIALCGKPIYSTSCNISGGAPLNSIAEIIRTFSSTNVALAVDDSIAGGGHHKSAASKVPSTIASVSHGNIKILRQGGVKAGSD